MPPPTQSTVSRHSQPFLFPKIQSTVLPDPSTFFSPNLLSSPLPTNSFFQNYVLKNGTEREYIHPYIIRSVKSELTLCFPAQFNNPGYTYEIVPLDLVISILNNPNPNTNHVISSFDDLSVTLDFPSSNLRFFLVRGSPFLTCNVMNSVEISISTAHVILELSPNSSNTRYKIKLNNNQTWLIYASSPVNLSHNTKTITSSLFSGVIRIAALPHSSTSFESTLDRFSSCYPVSGTAALTNPFYLEYKWEKRGCGDLLMLAHPLHVKLLSDADSSVSILDDFKYTSMDGELVGVVGDSWVLKSDPVSVTWHSVRGVDEEKYSEIIETLIKDVSGLNASAVTTSSSYRYGRLIARGARLALIAEEVCYPDVIPAIKKFLKEIITPWMDGTFGANGFFYDPKWGGLVTKRRSSESWADHGFDIYNDHHYQLGYFVYGISVLAKIDPVWGRKYKSQAYSLIADYLTLSRQPNSSFTRLRCFDLWKLHSWAGGLMEFPDGRNQQSSSKAVNAYYSAALLGLAYEDSHLVSIASTILSFEIHASKQWWHVKEEDNLYPREFTKENRIVGILWSTKRDSGLWIGPSEWKERRLGIQLLPLSPISEALFSDVNYVKQLVKWTFPALARSGVEEKWKGFVYALQGVYDKKGAIENIGKLTGYHDGNTLTNLLWWIYSRDDENWI